MTNQWSNLDELKGLLDDLLGNPPRITSDHLKTLAPVISRAAVLKLLDSLVADDARLAEIAARSYAHTLGFAKIVLLDPGLALPDGKVGYGYQLRLHIWLPDTTGGVPLVEAMHEHSFDFVSHMLTGEMENQCYSVCALSPSEQEMLAKLQLRVATLSATGKAEANRLIEALESQRLSEFGSQQASEEGVASAMVGKRLAELLDFNEADLSLLVALQGRFQSVASGVEPGKYVHRLMQTVKLQPHAVLKLRAGDTYHHPHPFAHRLYIRAGAANSTMIVTTPVSQEAMGGSFQRPTWVPEDEIDYARKMYSADELKSLLLDYRAQLQSESAEPGGSLLDVRSG